MEKRRSLRSVEEERRKCRGKGETKWSTVTKGSSEKGGDGPQRGDGGLED